MQSALSRFRSIWLVFLSRCLGFRYRPLSKQAVAVLHEVRALTGYGTLLFPNRNNPLEPMSDAAVNKVISLLGYKGRLSGHGFRHTMSTILHR